MANITTRTTTTPVAPRRRNSPYLPTPLERLIIAIFPALLIFGAFYSVISPQTRSAAYDPVTQSYLEQLDHHQQQQQHDDSFYSTTATIPIAPPSYFARKSNILNVLFVKRGWAWTTLAFTSFLLAHPSSSTPGLRLRAALRYVATTACWFAMTQWFFGAPIIDRNFRWSGGACEHPSSITSSSDLLNIVVTSVACKAAGGRWKGGHDISGHVFLLVLSTLFLLEEVGWPILRSVSGRPEERTVVMADGVTKGAGIEAETHIHVQGSRFVGFGFGGRFAMTVTCLNVWMLLMTAIYFHTWFEKFTGLLVALASWYLVYVVPRFVPVVRVIVGQPGI